MTWTENQIFVAVIVGGIIMVAFKLLGAGGGTTNNSNNPAAQLNAPGSRPGSVQNQHQQQTAANNNNNNAAATGSQLPQQLPSRNDDLATLIKNGKSKTWKIVLHTRTNFENIPTSSLRSATKNHPHLLLVHQLFTEASEASDVNIIKSNVEREYFPRDRLVLCTTDKGPEAVARQHEPVMFVSDNRDLCKFLSAFLTFVVLVDPSNASAAAIDLQYVSPSNPNSKTGPNKIYIVKNVEEILGQ